jgi:hypothetical protein
MTIANHDYKLKAAPWALLTVSVVWGFSFVVMKDAIERQSVNNFLFSRFALAVVVMVAIKPSVFRFFTKDLLLRGGAAGFFLGIGYIFQTLGLDLSPVYILSSRHSSHHFFLENVYLDSHGFVYSSQLSVLGFYQFVGGLLDLVNY